MINNWELKNQIGDDTGTIRYILLTDGTEQDARLLARKLKGYVKDISAASTTPYVYAFELPNDIDENTQSKLRIAIEEGVSFANKINAFVPGGAVGDPLFNANTLTREKTFPTFIPLDPSTSFLEQEGKPPLQKRPQLNLSANRTIDLNQQDALQVQQVSLGDTPENATARPLSPEESMLSTTAREVFATQIKQPDSTLLPQAGSDSKQPKEEKITNAPSTKDSTISISDQDMLLKEMEGSVLNALPLDDILSAHTRLDVFVDVNTPASTLPDKKTVPAPEVPLPSDQNAFNVFEPETNETDNLDVDEIHTITDKITQKNMDFINKSNIPEEISQPSSASQTEADTQASQSATVSPADSGNPALGSNFSGTPVPPASPSSQDVPSNDVRPENTLPSLPKAPIQRDNLPDITIRGRNSQFGPELPSESDMPDMEEISLSSSTAPHMQPPAHKTVLHLRRPAARPTPPSQPQSPGKTILRLRRKGLTPPVSEDSNSVKPLRSTMSPDRAAENIRLAKSKVIDHSIEIPTSELKKHNWPLEMPLVPTYTMGNMIMSVNRFAHATAISVIDNPGKLYNPLVLHGGTGTGKTHFLNALAYSFSQKFGQEHIFMTNGVRLSRGIQRYIMEGNIAKFETFMESVKVLLIDDIHLLAVNEQNREAISKLLTSFLRHQKQIVITSKYPPESLAKLEELIKFRLDAGWISELKPATGATHFRIVKKMLIENGVDLNDKQIEEFFGGTHMTLGTVTRSIRRLKVLQNLMFQSLEQDATSQAGIFEKLLATKGEDPSSELINKDPAEIVNITPMGNGEWGRIGIFYPQNCSNMMNWIVYALGQRAKELGITGGFEIAVRSSYATENIISSAFKIANLCDNKKLKGAIILGPQPNVCEPSVRENFYDILTHMLEIMLIRCGIINYENVRLPSTYVKLISELMR